MNLKKWTHDEKDELIKQMAALLDTWVDIERDAHFEDSQAHDAPGCNFCETLELLKEIGYYTKEGAVKD